MKQHLAALRMLGSFLVIRQVLAKNPAADVRGPTHIVTVGKTPVLTGADARNLFDSIETDTVAGLRDRALLGVMVYTFARVSAVTGLDVSDYYQVGRRMMIRLTEKGGRHHEMPAHHTAIEYLDAYLSRLGSDDGPLFRTITRGRNGYTERRIHRREVLAMVKRRCRAAGLGERFSNHTFRATGITAYLKNGGLLEHAQYMAAHASPTTTKLYDRRARGESGRGGAHHSVTHDGSLVGVVVFIVVVANLLPSVAHQTKLSIHDAAKVVEIVVVVDHAPLDVAKPGSPSLCDEENKGAMELAIAEPNFVSHAWSFVGQVDHREVAMIDESFNCFINTR
ncbi:MAG: tyrosine-type recombinase/integrase [Phycisphaerales bacterium]